MQDYLSKLKDAARGVKLRDFFTIEWVLALHGAIRALAQGQNITTEGGVTRMSGEAGVRLGGMPAKRARGGGAYNPCPLGVLTTWVEGEGEAAETKIGIKGGLVFCGKKNFRVNPMEIDTNPLAEDKDDLVYLEVTGILFRLDDSGTMTLPGILTATGQPEWKTQAWTEEGDYPDNVNPEELGGPATVIIPIGRLKVVDGVPSLQSEGCGNVRVTQCAGEVSFARPV